LALHFVQAKTTCELPQKIPKNADQSLLSDFVDKFLMESGQAFRL